MSTRRSRIIIIDDDLDVRDLVANYLKSKNYSVTTFMDAESALEKLETGFLCDAILTDLELPRMSGMDLTKRVKAAGIEIPVIVMTVNQELEVAMKAVSLGAFDFIVKPINFTQLQIAIERAIYLRRLTEDNQSLRTMIKDQDTQATPGIIGKSSVFVRTMDIAKRVAKSMANVMITGESGTGKEVVAKFIHSSSLRSNGPFVAINCSAIPESLLETELFGHAKGAFTGAQAQKIGLFEEATKGTIFLDEIGDMTLSLQSKLLRVLQERQIKRVGENQTRDIDVRMIFATHKNLANEVAEGRFREDLFFRLNVVPINLPALRDRKEDVIPLAEFFLKKYVIMNHSGVKSFSKEALQSLLDHAWKGNVRELENMIERAVVLSTQSVIQKNDLILDSVIAGAVPIKTSLIHQDFPVREDGELMTLNEIIQKYIQFALNKNSGMKDKTAKDLEIDRKTLYRRVRLMEPTH
ncbi:MAG: sigma-54-dependent Fis family transcriptional regulator [Proteobacteria bacterium]|jgi:two-component system response regulator HydG|nr:sigma-54-dependent Fis family transcriptional regulator [Pseudomonadota bacterium]